MGWKRPSGRVRELIRQGATMIVNSSAESFDKFFSATLASGYPENIADDPMLVEAIHQSDRSIILHWAAANVTDPGEPVPAKLGAEAFDYVRGLMQRGVDEAVVIDQYRICQNQALQNWMRIALRLTPERDELRELQTLGTRSITSFVNATIAGIRHQMQAERDEITRRMHLERHKLVTLILDGAPIASQTAESQLGYRLDQSHTAAVIWGSETATTPSDLDRAAEALTRTAGERRSLAVPDGAPTRWVWLPGAAIPDLAGVTTAVRDLPGVRVAVGSTGAGVEGFRASHREAITTQRTLVRLGSTRQVADFADIQLVALITADPDWANQFISRTLGDFESADAELQRTVLTFVREQCNASHAAGSLFTHRNTLLNRLARADKLLPRPLEENSVHVAVALEVLSWRGAAN
ncbi:MAG TPA: PucR family transcriptional regulator [Mycobacterium sp.]|nr:PucR family transcriptional regulator [Mycobacterium sp.]